MQAKGALLGAVITGALAVLLVGLDTAWGTSITLQGLDEDGDWITVATNDPDAWRYERFGSCVTEHRIVIENHRPLARSLAVHAAANGAGRDVEVLFDDVVQVAAFAAHVIELDTPAPWTWKNETVHPTVWVEAGGQHLSASRCHFIAPPEAER